jgi:hypothetical protein
MDGMTVVWIVVALAALVIVVAVIASTTRSSSNRKAEAGHLPAGGTERRETAQEARTEPTRRQPPAQNLWPEPDQDGTADHWTDGAHRQDPRNPTSH